MGKRAARSRTNKPVRKVTTSNGQTLTPSAPIKSYHNGGKVQRTGPAKLKKGEIVLTASQAKMCHGKPTKKKGARKRITKE